MELEAVGRLLQTGSLSPIAGQGGQTCHAPELPQRLQRGLQRVI
jgi:hypothetical protein